MNITIKNNITLIETDLDLTEVLKRLEFSCEKVYSEIDVPITRIGEFCYLYKKVKGGYEILTGSLPFILRKIDSDKTIINPNKPQEVKGQISSKLRDYQKDIIEKILFYKRLIVKSPTGSGKSWLIAETCRLINKKIIILVPFIDLSSQIKKSVESYLGEEVGYIGNSINITRRVTVAIPNSLVKAEEIDAEVLICDEVHTMGNSTGLKIISKFSKLQYSIGFSATPKISDFRIIEGMTGPIRVDITEKNMMQENYILRPDIYFVKYKTFPISYRLSNANLNKSWTNKERSLYSRLYDEVIVKNEHRNKCIVQITSNYLEKNSNGVVLILVKRVGSSAKISHALTIQRLLEINDIKFPILQGSTKSKVRDDLLNKLRSEEIRGLIASDKIIGCGIDILNVSCIVLASGGAQQKDFIQMVGRSLRLDSFNRNPEVWDFIDEVNILKEHSRKRQGYAKSIYGSYRIVEMK